MLAKTGGLPMNNRLPLANLKTRALCVLTLWVTYSAHLFIMPIWMFVMIAIIGVSRFYADYKSLPPLSRWVKALVIAALFITLNFYYGRPLTSEFFIALLISFVGLKLIELHSIRDIKFLVFADFYLILSALILVQELWIIPYMLVAIMTNLNVLLYINAPQASLRTTGKKSLQLLLIALPVSLVLFYIFPRVSEPLWRVLSASTPKSGIGDSMSPGAISNLLMDESTALRVRFLQAPPVLNGYWKGVILDFYSGMSWSAFNAEQQNLPPLTELTSERDADYEVMIEPRSIRWLFYIGTPKAGLPQLRFASNAGLQSSTKTPLHQRFSYALQLSSKKELMLSPNAFKRYLQIPEQANPKLKAWANKYFLMHNKHVGDYIKFLGDYVHNNNYWYSLRPPKLLQNRQQMDQFWFDTQSGFCEHYTSAFAFILRTVGIPSRVVLGYYGGAWNPYGEYLSIKQSNAHSWIEYWTEGDGWKRLDPTTFINPSRIDPELLIASLNRQQTNADTLTLTHSLFMQIDLYWESTQYFMQRWLLFYNQEHQKALFEQIGIASWDYNKLIQSSIGMLIGFFIFFTALFHFWSNMTPDPFHTALKRLKRQFQRLGIQTPPDATLHILCTTLKKYYPSCTQSADDFLERYDILRLSPKSSKISQSKHATAKLLLQFAKTLKSVRPVHPNFTHQNRADH